MLMSKLRSLTARSILSVATKGRGQFLRKNSPTQFSMPAYTIEGPVAHASEDSLSFAVKNDVPLAL